MPQSFANGVPASGFSKLENQIKPGAVGSGNEANVRFLHAGIGFESYFVKEKRTSQRVIVYCLTRDGKVGPLVLPLSAYRKVIDQCKMSCRHDRPWDINNGPWLVIGTTGSGIDTRYQIGVQEVCPFAQEKAESIRKAEQMAMDYAVQEERWKEKVNSAPASGITATFTPTPTPIVPVAVNPNPMTATPTKDVFAW